MSIFIRFKLYSFIKEKLKKGVTNLTLVTAWFRQNGGGRGKWNKLLKIHSQNAYVWSGISKIMFKNFLAQILRKLQMWHC